MFLFSSLNYYANQREFGLPFQEDSKMIKQRQNENPIKKMLIRGRNNNHNHNNKNRMLCVSAPKDGMMFKNCRHQNQVLFLIRSHKKERGNKREKVEEKI